VIDVSLAQLEDLPAITALLEEVDRFYGVTEFEPQQQRAEQIRALLFRPVPVAFVLLARDHTEPMGLAAYSFLWPAAGITASLFLKELYISDAHRGRGVGRLLMERLQDIAAKEGCSRLEWTTDRDNEAAQAFYKAIGFEADASKVIYRASTE
jgi:GNAT superfamily N-acetyltransferase